MMMSIAHGSNDGKLSPDTPLTSETTANSEVTVANAVGPWVASYNTYTSGTVTAKADTPIWILVTAGLLLGLGFWCMFHISRR
jgi:phosphate/sulfate permease